MSHAPMQDQQEVSFECTSAELQLVRRIVFRVFDAGTALTCDEMDLEMDLVATHANGCPLDFEKLLGFDDFNLKHDIYGIRNCLNRSTGELTNNFRPRCAIPVLSSSDAGAE